MATSIKLLTDTRDTIVSNILNRLRANSNFTNMVPGGKARVLVETIADTLSTQIENVKVAQVANLVGYASGAYLDALGEILGVIRWSEETAEASDYARAVKLYTITTGFGDINSGMPISIPSGTQVWGPTDNGQSAIYYEISEDVVLSATDTEAYVPVRALTSGSGGNTSEGQLRFITFSGYTDSANSSLLVTNEASITTGRDAETDINYRYRIVNQASNLATANEMAIRLAALSVPGVANIRLMRWKRGIGTADLVVRATTPTTSLALVGAVRGAVSIVESIGNYIYVMKPEEIGIQIELTVYYTGAINASDKSDIERKIATSITDYVNNLEMGEGLIVNELVQGVMEQDGRILDIGTPNQPLTALYAYVYSVVEDRRVKQRVTWNYLPQEHQKLVIEPSISNAIIIRSIA